MSLNSCVLINIQHRIHVKYLIVGKNPGSSNKTYNTKIIKTLSSY